MENFAQRLHLNTIYFLIGILMCVLIASCTATEVKQGEKLVERGNLDGAVTAYQEALRKDPFNEELQKKVDDLKERAAQAHYAKGKQWLEANRIPDALQEFQLAMTMDPYKPEHQAGLVDAMRLKEAQQALKDGNKLQTLGRLEEALTQYERAIELNPNLVEALDEITAIAQHQKAYQAMGETAEPVTLRFQNTRLKQVFEILARTANIDILFDKDVRDDLVTIFTRDTPFNEALNLILTTNQLFAKRVAPDTLLIIPDTKQKHEQYQDLKIRTFYLSNAKAKDMANLLRTILETKRVYVNEPLNTVVVRDNPAKVSLAEHIIDANDRADAEVLFDVEVLEVVQTTDQRYGLSFAKQAGFGVFSPGTNAFPQMPNTQTFSIQELPSLGPSEYLVSLPSNVVVDFFKNRSDVKTLASPKLRVLNNEKASINVGDKQPILLSTTNVLPGQASTGVTPTTSTVTSIEFKDVGIKVTVEPTIHLNDEITLRLQIEITNLGDEVTLQTNPEIKQFRFGTRTADTALNLKDGETVVLAGLIREDDRKTRQSIPLIGDIPYLGKLFSNYTTQKVTTEVILVITPHLMKSVTPAELVKQTVWSGTAKKYATEPLFTAKPIPMALMNGQGTQFGENGNLTEEREESPSTSPSSPPPKVATIPQGPSSSQPDPDQKQEQAAAHLTLLPSAISRKVGEEIRVDLKGEDIPSIEKSRVTISYNPDVVQFVQVVEGQFWKQNNIPPSLTVSAVPKAGQIVIQMGKQGQSASGSGQLATLVFRAKAVGNVPLEIQRPSFIRADKKPVPVITQHGRIWVQ